MKTVNSTHFANKKSDTIIPISLRSALVACAISLGVMSSASAAIIYVNSAAPAGGNGSSWGAAFNTVGAALDAATTTAPPVDIWIEANLNAYPMPRCNYPLPNNVNLYGGFVGTETNLSQRSFNGNLPSFPSTLTEPPGNNCYLFALSGTTNRLDGVTISSGAGILQSGGTLTVVSDTFTTGPGDDYGLAVIGGGIASYNGANLVVDKSLFKNIASGAGGAIASVNAASVKITNSTFNNNQGLGVTYYNPATASLDGFSGGGAIYVDGNFQYYYYDYGTPIVTSATLSGNTFINNSTSSGPLGGGAIHVEDSGTVNIANSTFGALDTNGIPVPGSGNQTNTGANGGAISLKTSNSLALSGNNFYGNVSYSGGAIYSEKENGPVSITNSKFTRNSATVGGAIADANESNSTLMISGNTFTQNMNIAVPYATSKGPAIFYDATEQSVNAKTSVNAIDNALIKSNTSLRSSDIAP